MCLKEISTTENGKMRVTTCKQLVYTLLMSVAQTHVSKRPEMVRIRKQHTRAMRILVYQLLHCPGMLFPSVGKPALPLSSRDFSWCLDLTKG